MITYRGLPAPIVCDFLSREQSRAHYSGHQEQAKPNRAGHDTVVAQSP